MLRISIVKLLALITRYGVGGVNAKYFSCETVSCSIRDLDEFIKIMAPKKDNPPSYPIRKKFSEVKTKYSPIKKTSSRVNNVYVKGFKFGLISLQLKKGTNPDEDAYFKDFEDMLDSDPKISEQLGIIKITHQRKTNKSDAPKMSSTGFRSKQIIGVAPQSKENDSDFRKEWAEKIVSFLNDIKWRYENSFRLRCDLTNEKNYEALDHCLLDKDIGAFLGAYIFEKAEELKGNSVVLSEVFSETDNLDDCFLKIYENWNNWIESEN